MPNDARPLSCGYTCGVCRAFTQSACMSCVHTLLPCHVFPMLGHVKCSHFVAPSCVRTSGLCYVITDVARSRVIQSDFFQYSPPTHSTTTAPRRQSAKAPVNFLCSYVWIRHPESPGRLPFGWELVSEFPPLPQHPTNNAHGAKRPKPRCQTATAPVPIFYVAI